MPAGNPVTPDAPPSSTVTPYRSAVPVRRGGFGRLLHAEWTKLTTVPRWLVTLLAAVLLTVGTGLLVAAGAGGQRAGGEVGGAPARSPVGKQSQDSGYLLYRPLADNGTLVARVAHQRDSHPWAKAGLMVRQSTERGAPYTAVVVTPDHGVLLRSSGTSQDEDVTGGSQDSPRWLKLARSGSLVTAYESTDGAAWDQVGSVRFKTLPAQASAGLFVASPDDVGVQRQFGGESIESEPTFGQATFDSVRMEPVPQQTWRGHGMLTGPGVEGADNGGFKVNRSGGFTLTGSGDIGPDLYLDDDTESVLSGVLVGVLPIVALAVLFITSEYRQGMVRTTFTAAPQRGRVLAAKAVVLGGATFVAGLVASLGTFLLAGPVRGPDAPLPELTEGPVLRAVVGTAGVVAVAAVFSLAVAALFRRSAVAIAVVLLLLLVPQIVATGLPLSAAQWLERLTPAAGLAIQQTVERYDSAIGPWNGFGVLCGYTVLLLVTAAWRIRRRDA